MGCGNEKSKWDDNAVQDSLAGKNTGIETIPKEILEGVMPAVEKALHNSMVRCLEENLGNARENIGREGTQKGGSEAFPTQQQLDEMVKVGQELKIPETEIICTPLICGTGGVVDMSGKIRDVMDALHHSPIPPQFRDDTVFSKIVFVNRQEMGKTGLKVADFDPGTKVLCIFKNADGVFPTREALKWTIFPHEIPHASEEFKIKIGDHTDELEAVVAIEQALTGGNISPYVEGLGKLYKEGKISGETYAEEWVSECCVRYVTGKCTETTRKLFDELFSE